MQAYECLNIYFRFSFSYFILKSAFSLVLHVWGRARVYDSVILLDLPNLYIWYLKIEIYWARLCVCARAPPWVCTCVCCVCIVVLEDVMGAWFILKFIISAFSGFLDFVRLFEILKLLV
jgi:hypothetical protein